MNILLLGKTGQVGWELLRTLAPLGAIVAPDHEALDLAQPDSIRSYVRDLTPGLIVNAAAYTAVDQAESEPERAMLINATAPGILAEEARRLNVPLVHYSTDYVFDGTKPEAYTEQDVPNPLSVYGRSKLDGERALQAVAPPFLIFRTSWVYGARGRNFLRTILRLARERDHLRIVEDQIGAPTWSRLIAEVTAMVLSRFQGAYTALNPEDQGGVYHLAASGATNWCDFARAIVAGDARKSEHRVRDVQPIPASEYPTPARRPAYSCLDCTALRKAFGINLPDWRSSLDLVLEDLS